LLLPNAEDARPRSPDGSLPNQYNHSMSLDVEEHTRSESSVGNKSGLQTTRINRSRPHTSQRWNASTVIVLLTTAAALALGLWSLSRKLAPQITAPVSPDFAYVASFPERSIAVLPFDDLDGAAENMSLSEAVQDDILHALSKVADLKVISRTSVCNYP